MSKLNLLWCILRLPKGFNKALASKTKQTLSAQKRQAQIAKKMGKQAQDEMVTIQQLLPGIFQYIQNQEVILIRWQSLQMMEITSQMASTVKNICYWLTKWQIEINERIGAHRKKHSKFLFNIMSFEYSFSENMLQELGKNAIKYGHTQITQKEEAPQQH